MWQFLWVFFFSQSVFACDVYIRQQEQMLQMPADLLRAIALVESGKSDKGQRVSWPWTINANGKGYTFQTKQAAIDAVQNFQRQGIKSIDVGCLQINLKHHPNAFRSLSDAFDPQLNVAYGAQFLRSLKDQYASWYEATAHYHSATPQFHTPYRRKIINQWQKLRKEKGVVLPALHDTSFMGKTSTMPSFTPSVTTPSVTYTQYQQSIHQQPSVSQVVKSGPGKFISLSGSVKVKVHRYTVDGAAAQPQEINGKVFFPLRS